MARHQMKNRWKDQGTAEEAQTFCKPDKIFLMSWWIWPFGSSAFEMNLLVTALPTC